MSTPFVTHPCQSPLAIEYLLLWTKFGMKCVCVRACVRACVCVCVCVLLHVSEFSTVSVVLCVGDPPGALGEEQSQASLTDWPRRRGTCYVDLVDLLRPLGPLPLPRAVQGKAR